VPRGCRAPKLRFSATRREQAPALHSVSQPFGVKLVREGASILVPTLRAKAGPGTAKRMIEAAEGPSGALGRRVGREEFGAGKKGRERCVPYGLLPFSE